MPLPTQNDVAKRAGVSAKTVSRVINGERYVKPELVERVQEAIQELGYVPNPSAQRLTSRPSRQIAVIYDPVTWSWIGDILWGVSRRCRESDYQLLLFAVDDETKDPGAKIQQLVAHGDAEGVVLLYPQADTQSVLDVLKRAEVPYARILPLKPGGPSHDLTVDDFGGTKTAIEYLIAQGHRRIAYIIGNRIFPNSLLRYEGYKAALEDHGIPLDESLVVQGNFHPNSGYNAGLSLLESETPPTAIACANDEMAGGVLSAAYEKHVRVPDELSVIGFDDSTTASHAIPRLTTIRQPWDDMGYQAVDAVLSQLGGGATSQQVVLPLTLVERESVTRRGSRAPSKGR